MLAPKRLLRSLAVLSCTAGLVALAYQPAAPRDELEGRIPRPAPYVVAEARVFLLPTRRRGRACTTPAGVRPATPASLPSGTAP